LKTLSSLANGKIVLNMDVLANVLFFSGLSMVPVLFLERSLNQINAETLFLYLFVIPHSPAFSGF